MPVITISTAIISCAALINANGIYGFGMGNLIVSILFSIYIIRSKMVQEYFILQKFYSLNKN
jgi:hypothetical protein